MAAQRAIAIGRSAMPAPIKRNSGMNRETIAGAKILSLHVKTASHFEFGF
jgi:hypothetical protein